MTITAYSLFASMTLIAVSPAAEAGCTNKLNDEIASAARLVNSLRFDKSSQMRVFASDGSEYTAGQTAWMKGQLRGIARSCTQGDEVTATASLRDVESVLHEHHRKG